MSVGGLKVSVGGLKVSVGGQMVGVRGDGCYLKMDLLIIWVDERGLLWCLNSGTFKFYFSTVNKNNNKKRFYMVTKKLKPEDHGGLVPAFLRSQDAPLLTAIMQTSIFAPHKKGEDYKFVQESWDIVKPDGSKKIVTMAGYQCDQAHDFKIWATLLREFDTEGGISYSVSEKDLLGHLGYPSKKIDSKRKEFLRRRVKKMQDVSITISECDESGNERGFLKFSLLQSVSLCPETKVYTFEFSNQFFEAYNKEKWRALDLNFMKRINTEYAQSLFCFYETKVNNAIKITSGKYHPEDLVSRLKLDGKETKEVNRVLNNAHKKLVEVGQLKSFKKPDKESEYYRVDIISKPHRGSLI